VRFTTQDGRIGFLVEATSYSGMYRFQLIVDGGLVGDDEPCFLESAMSVLGSLPTLDDPRLDAVLDDPASVLALLQTDDALHDAATLSIAESLDRWLVCAFVHVEQVTVLAQPYADEEDILIEPLLAASVPVAEYTTVFENARAYWSELRYPSA
jgi:hypothetical protein